MSQLRSRTRQHVKSASAPRTRQKTLPVPPNWFVGGVLVVGEELVYNLPNVPLRGYSRLLLADDTSVFRCKDCTPDVIGTRGDLMAHRNRAHGGRIGKNRFIPGRIILEELHSVPLPPDQEPPPDPDPVRTMTMSFGELTAIAPSIKAMGDLMDELETQRDRAYRELDERRAYDKAEKHKIDAYDEMRRDLLDLKLQARKDKPKIDGYDDLHAEVVRLRTWKTKFTNKLKSMGFVLSEEDENGS